MRSGQPLPCFFPWVSFTVYHSRSHWHQRGGRNTWLGPPFLTPAHTQAALKQSWNCIINNVGNNFPTDTVIPIKSRLAPVTIFIWIWTWGGSLLWSWGGGSPMSSAGKPSSLQCSTTDSSKHTPSDSSTDPAAGILILIFIHCSISISYTFSFQDINQAVSLRFPPPSSFMLQAYTPRKFCLQLLQLHQLFYQPIWKKSKVLIRVLMATETPLSPPSISRKKQRETQHSLQKC